MIMIHLAFTQIKCFQKKKLLQSCRGNHLSGLFEHYLAFPSLHFIYLYLVQKRGFSEYFTRLGTACRFAPKLITLREVPNPPK